LIADAKDLNYFVIIGLVTGAGVGAAGEITNESPIAPQFPSRHCD